MRVTVWFASVREDNPLELASVLSPVHTQKPCNNFLIAPACIYFHFVRCGYFMLKHWNISKRCNNLITL